PKVAIGVRPGADGMVEDHPVDLLRVHLVLGAIDSMAKLDPAVRADYVASIEAIAGLIGGGATAIHVEGKVPGQGGPTSINVNIRLAEAAAAARKVGSMIATRKFRTLNGHSIQEIETWDDADEAAAKGIATLMAQRQSVVGHGDDAQLLAGATLALLGDTGLN